MDSYLQRVKEVKEFKKAVGEEYARASNNSIIHNQNHDQNGYDMVMT